MTHGIYGAGSNWRGIARAINNRRPDWGVVLVDLRHHGRSEPGDPPHTLDACAGDLEALIGQLGELGSIEALAGHSFGGKVVLATRSRVRVRQTWMLDASPSARPEAFAQPDHGALDVLAMLESLPKIWPRREDFVAAVVGEGHAIGLAQWLAMNVVSQDGAYVLRLDLGALREMLASYFAADLWQAVAADRGDLEIVLADRSTTVSAADRARLAGSASHVHVHHVDAGHWLHIDAPAAIVELFATHLP
ncbi:MAG: alpha/beta hydrolase fold protein [Deltaproteobacteria bacterium]|nr:alpha/beta hydrolase fold protein [Deltaproteobacteria bacterium]